MTVIAQVRALRVQWGAVIGANGYKVQWRSGPQGYDPAGRDTLTFQVTVLDNPILAASPTAANPALFPAPPVVCFSVNPTRPRSTRAVNPHDLMEVARTLTESGHAPPTQGDPT